MTGTDMRVFAIALLGFGLTACVPDNVRDPYYADPYYGGNYPVYPVYPPGGYYNTDPDGRTNIRNRINQTEQSIRSGARRGTLTTAEEQSLRQELNGIGQKVDQMKSDGYLSPRERERINNDIDRLQRRVQREKRDDERRTR